MTPTEKHPGSLSRPAQVFLHVLILCVLSTAAPSDSVPPTLELEPVDASEVALFEDVSEWVDEEREVPTDRASVRDEIRRRSTSFEVFRSYHGAEERHALVGTMPYGEIIRRASLRYGVDALLLASVIEAESGFDPRAVSRRGAVGLMQLLPTTAGTDAESLVDPTLNVDRGARYLRGLLDLYGGDLELALAAYNAGPGNVRRHGGVPPFRETRAYVEKVLRRYVDHHRTVWQASEDADLLLG